MSIFEKTETVATVVDRALVKELVSEHGITLGVKLRYVLEVRPPGEPSFRVKEDVKVWDPVWEQFAPTVGDEVAVSYHGDHPDHVKVHIKGDPRYDEYLADKMQQDDQKAAAANDVARLDAEFEGA